MCWNVATAPLDNNVIEKKGILCLDLFLWENGYYCDPVNAHSCYYSSLFAAWTSGGKGTVADVRMCIFLVLSCG